MKKLALLALASLVLITYADEFENGKMKKKKPKKSKHKKQKHPKLDDKFKDLEAKQDPKEKPKPEPKPVPPPPKDK